MSQVEKLPETTERPRIAPGWYRDLSNDDYHGSMGYSSSQLKKLIEQTPAHLLQSFSEHREPTPNMQLGTAVHSLVLEPEAFDNDVAIRPSLNLRTKDGRAARDAFEAENVGKAIITPEQYQQAQDMAASVRDHPVAGVLLQDIITESSIYWWYRSMDPDDESQYKTMLKVRPDALCQSYPVIVDLKTCADGSYTGFMKSIQNFYYHVSAAMYLEGVNQNKQLLFETGHFAYTKFVFVCVESSAPYLTSIYELSPEYLDIGKTLYRRALIRLRDGQENNWPGFPDEIRVMDPPGWASKAHIV